MLKALNLSICVIFFAGSMAEANVLGFRAWKTQRMEDARAAIERTQAEASGDRQVPSERTVQVRVGSASTRVQKGKGESRLKQAQNNLELATELTINDYFVLYLSQQDSPDAIPEAAKKMSPEEVAELMAAYKKRLENGRSEIGLVPSPVGTPSRL